MALVRSDPTALAALAAKALELASSDPGRGRQAAEAVLAAAPRDAVVRATAMHAFGLALAQQGEVVEAIAALRRCIAFARRTHQQRREGLARTSLVYALALRGRIAAALQEAAEAEAKVTGIDRARLLAQRGLLLQRLGRSTDALADFRRALPVLRRGRDDAWVFRILNNRAILLTYLGRIPAALIDLDAAGELARSLGLAYAAATVEHNRGFARGRQGDVPAALASFDAAEAEFRRLGAPLGPPLVDRCEVLLGVHLVEEGRAAAAEAVAQLSAASLATDLAEAQLLYAEALLLTGEHDQARDAAGAARRAFVRHGRHSWAALA